ASWPDKLPNVLHTALIDAFEKSGRIDQVASDTKGVRSDYLLQIDIRDFEARYADPEGAPTTVVALQARLVARHDRTIAGHLSVREESAAQQNTIGAAIDAFDRATGAAIAKIVSWALSAVPPGKIS